MGYASPMVDFLGLAIIVTAVVVVVVLAILGAPLLFSSGGRTRCERCGATIPASADECTICEAPFEAGPSDEDEAAPREIEVRTPEPDPEEGVINPGVTKGMIRWAIAIMFVGVGVRVLGMLEPAGLSLGIPDAVTAALTVAGGLAMFFGFVVLDIA